MNPNHSELEDLLILYVQNEANPEQTTQAEHLIRTNPEVKQLFHELKTTLELAGNDPIPSVSTENAKQRFKHRYEQEQRSTTSKKGSWKWAAAAVVAISLSYVTFYFTNAEKAQFQSLNTDSIQLPEGSSIHAQTAMNFSWHEDFKNHRSVRMGNGKAFFNIAKDRKHPFTIEVGESEVMVLGTSFEIEQQKNHTTLRLETGKVRFVTGSDTAYLTPGQEINVENGKQLAVENIQNPNYLSWHTREVVFNNTRFTEAVHTVAKELMVQNITIDSKLQGCFITGTFQLDSGTESFQQMARLIDAEVTQTKENNEIIITGEGCPF